MKYYVLKSTSFFKDYVINYNIHPLQIYPFFLWVISSITLLINLSVNKDQLFNPHTSNSYQVLHGPLSDFTLGMFLFLLLCTCDVIFFIGIYEKKMGTHA